MTLFEATWGVRVHSPQATGPRPRAVRGQQQGLNTPPSGRQRCYSSLPSKHITRPPGENVDPGVEGFRVPPIPAAPGRTQPTPSASRSDGAELAGVAISLFGISCSNRSKGQYPTGHLQLMVKHSRPKTKGLARFPPHRLYAKTYPKEAPRVLVT